MEAKFVQYDLPGISIFVPPQNNGHQLLLKEKALLTFTGKSWRYPFNLIRQIANIALYWIGPDGQEKIETNFSPPIELRVGYHTNDLMQAGCGIDRLKLAYWDGADWVVFIDGINCHYRILPPGTAQVAEITFEHWAGDPPLAWGD